MNRKLWVLIPLGVLLICLLLTAGCAKAGDAQLQVGQQPEGFWVSGTGKISVNPDMATVQLGVQSQEENVADARVKAADGMSKLVQALQDEGIADTDIQTGNFTINQRTHYDNYNEKYDIIGYQVTNIVTVKIRDINNAGIVIDKAVEAGGDLIRINNLTFSVEDPSSYYKEVREKAIADARDKAEQYAKLISARLGNATYVAEGTLTSNVTQGYYGSNYPVPTIIEYSLSGGTFISPGENEIILTVTVSYEIIR